MLLLKPIGSVQQVFVRHYGVNVYRWKKGLAPRYAYSPISETAEFSYTDGKGFSPMNKMQKARYERDQVLVSQVVKYMKQFEEAKKLAASKK